MRTTLTDSLTHWTAWPATGCALQSWRSLAMSQAASAVYPTSVSSGRIQVCRGRPRGRFHSGLSSGRWPEWVLTAGRSASCAGTDSRLQATYMSKYGHWCCCRCCAVESGSSPITLGTKSNQRNPRMRRKHDIWNASSFSSSDLVSVGLPISYTTAELGPITRQRFSVRRFRPWTLTLTSE